MLIPSCSRQISYLSLGPLKAVQVDKQTLKLYPVVDSSMKPPECTHAFQTNKMALSIPGIDHRGNSSPSQKNPSVRNDVDKAIKQFDRDFYLEVFFADDDNTSDDEEPIEKLRVTSKWMPDQPPHSRSLNDLGTLKVPCNGFFAQNTESAT
jgi:hypothetical protein